MGKKSGHDFGWAPELFFGENEHGMGDIVFTNEKQVQPFWFGRYYKRLRNIENH